MTIRSVLPIFLLLLLVSNVSAGYRIQEYATLLVLCPVEYRYQNNTWGGTCQIAEMIGIPQWVEFTNVTYYTINETHDYRQTSFDQYDYCKKVLSSRWGQLHGAVVEDG